MLFVLGILFAVLPTLLRIGRVVAAHPEGAAPYGGRSVVRWYARGRGRAASD